MKVTRNLLRLGGGAVVLASTLCVAVRPSADADEYFVVTRVVDGRPTFSTVDSATAHTLRRNGELVTRNITAKLASPTVDSTEDGEYHPQPFSWMSRVAAVETPAVVAVIDTGVDPTHPLLQGSLIPGTGFVQHTGASSVAWADGNGHGTHVAGTVITTNPFVKILPVRVLDREGSGEVAPIAEGIVWAVDNGAHVLNISLGLTSDSSLDLLPLRVAVEYATRRGVLVVTAAGNEAEFGSPSVAPAMFDDPIAVAALQNSEVASFSNRNSYVDIATDGVDVWSSALGGGMERMSGTSMASPKVAAVAAGLMMLNPTWTASDVKDQLLATATDRGTTGPDPVYGFGEMNLYLAFSSELSRPAGLMPSPTPTRVTVKPVMGGVTVTSRQGTVFVKHQSGEIEVLTKRYPFISLTRAATVEVWTYNKAGAPTRPLTKRLTPAKLPTIRALVTRSGSSARLKIISKVPPEALLSVSTVSRAGIEREVAVLYPAVGAIAVPSPKFRWFKVCYAVEDRTLGCRKFPLG